MKEENVNQRPEKPEDRILKLSAPYYIQLGDLHDEFKIPLTGDELILIHSLLCDKLEKITCDKFHNDTQYSVDAMFLEMIENIEKQIWYHIDGGVAGNEMIQTFIDAKENWVAKHRKEIEVVIGENK